MKRVVNMEIILGASAGFCGGIIGAVSRANKELENNNKLYCLGDLTHNNIVMKDLKDKGLVVVDDIKEAKEKTLIRAHGITKETYEEAKNLNIELIDCTCPKVLAIHKTAMDYANMGYYIVLIGELEHPEVVGTFSFCGEHKSKIADKEQINQVINNIKKSGLNKVLIIAQTTFNMQLFDEISFALKTKLEPLFSVEIKKTICNATENRQKETKEIAQEVDLMIIIGSKKSSNTNKLFDISKEFCSNTIMVEDFKELDLNFVKNFKKIGIMAGASAPKKSIDGVIDYLNKI